MQVLKRELQRKDEIGSELDTNDLLFTIMNKKYSKERKKAKLLATILTFSDTSVNQRAPSGMTALHRAVQVCCVIKQPQNHRCRANWPRTTENIDTDIAPEKLKIIAYCSQQ